MYFGDLDEELRQLVREEVNTVNARLDELETKVRNFNPVERWELDNAENSLSDQISSLRSEVCNGRVSRI